MSKDNIEIGQRIKSIRIRLGLTMEEFGKKFTPVAAKGAVSNWEKGNYLPNNERLKKIAELGNVDISFLLTGLSNDTHLSSMDFLRLALENAKAKEVANKESYKRLNNYLWNISDNKFDEETIKLLYSSLLFAQLNEPPNKDIDPKKIRFLNYIINHLNLNLKKDTDFTTDELVNDLSEKLRYIIEN